MLAKYTRFGGCHLFSSKTAISQCIEEANVKDKEELDSLLTLRFQTFEKAQLLAA